MNAPETHLRAAPEATLTQGMQKVECRMQKFGSKPPLHRECRRLNDGARGEVVYYRG